MPIHEKVLFIGAKGEYDHMPFEILGSGQVDYTITYVSNPDDSDDIGQTFPAIEYYCLANNGQTWYFAVNDEEVYYCRQLQAEEVTNLQNLLNLPANKQDYEKSLRQNRQVRLNEAGKGRLTQAQGRAVPDLYEYGEFTYYDFRFQQKDYSLDVFPEDHAEWFETVWVPNRQLTEIFQDSLRLLNSQAEEFLATVRLWNRIGWLSLLAALGVLITAFVLSQNASQVYDETKFLQATEGQEIRFENIPLEPGNLHKFTTRTELPTGAGLSLSFSFFDEDNQIVSQNYQEYVHTQSTDWLSQTVSFFPTKAEKLDLVVQVNDYGGVGIAPESDLSQAEASFIKPTLPLTVQLTKNNIEWTGWIITAGLSFVVGLFSFSRAVAVSRQAWQTYDQNKFAVKTTTRDKN